MNYFLISTLLTISNIIQLPGSNVKIIEPNNLKQYTGIFQVSPYFQLRVYVKNGNQLMMSVPQEPDYALVNQTRHKFDIKQLPGYQVVFQVKKNTSRKLTILRPRKDFPNDLAAIRKKRLDRFAINVDAQLTEWRESAHFKFNFAKTDVNTIKQIQKGLENSYHELLKCFGIIKLPKILIRIYPSKSTYLMAINRPKSNLQIQLATEWGKQDRSYALKSYVSFVFML